MAGEKSSDVFNDFAVEQLVGTVRHVADVGSQQRPWRRSERVVVR